MLRQIHSHMMLMNQLMLPRHLGKAQLKSQQMSSIHLAYMFRQAELSYPLGNLQAQKRMMNSMSKTVRYMLNLSSMMSLARYM